ncbi:MAG: AAA family ATPase [Parachlamydiaceae bacterium]|nr:AAA family ATPase [Parachlamydiaceae bacterium]
MFDHIIGNVSAKNYLKRVIERGTIGNSLLFAGPEGVGKSLFAESFAKEVICFNDPNGRHRDKIQSGNHPDIRVYRPEGKIGMHSIASMRQFSQEVYLSPSEADYKVFILHEAERMLSYSANALLKTFEEPPLDTIIILLSSSSSTLLPTVLSRCRMIYFKLLLEEDVASFLMKHHQKNSEEAQAIALLAQGSIGNALRLIQQGGDPLRTMVINLLSQSELLTYKQIAECAGAIAEQMELDKKEIEDDVRGYLKKEAMDNLSAAQKQSIEKEIEGAVAMNIAQKAQSLFNIILGWYRDLQMIGVNGNRQYAIHGDYLSVCEENYHRGGSLPLELVQKVLSEARLALERSTSLNICFENLFLKLNLIKI